MAYAQISMVTDLQLTAVLQPVHAHCPPDSLIRQVSHKKSAAIRAVYTVLSALRRGRCPLGTVRCHTRSENEFYRYPVIWYLWSLYD